MIGALTVGGTERQLIGILNQLDRQKFQPFLFTFYSHGALVEQVPNDVIHYCDQIDNTKQPKRWVPGAIQRHLSKSLSTYCQSQQIDVVYDRTFHVSLVTGAACAITKTPYLNTIVANPFKDFYATAGIFGRIKYGRLRRIYRSAAAVLCVSRGVVQAAADFYRLPSSLFFSCPNFIDQSRMDQIRVAAKQRSMLTKERALIGNDEDVERDARLLRIIAVGRLHYDKGVDILLRAIGIVISQHQLKVQLTLVGDGPDRQALQKLSEGLSIQSSVRFMEWVANPAPFIAEADLFVLSSRSEGMPNSLLEAMLIGTPAIATDCPFGPAEITEDGTLATLVRVEDPKAMANAIIDFAGDSIVAMEKAAKAMANLQQRFGPDAGIERLESFLLNAAKHQAMPSQQMPRP